MNQDSPNPTSGVVKNQTSADRQKNSDKRVSAAHCNKKHACGKCYCRIACRFLKNICCWITTEKIIAVAAIAAIIVAFFALDIAKNHMVSANRAWVAPGKIRFEEVPPDAKHRIVGLEYKNTGNQPATKFNYKIDLFPIPSGDIHNIPIVKRAILDAMGGEKCKAFSKGRTESTVFPNSGRKLLMEISPADVQKYTDGTNFIVVAGYFAYHTFEKTRRSCFCRFFDFTANRHDPSKWRSSVCDVPEYAD